VVYANHGTPEDFDKLEKLKVDVRGKIVLVVTARTFAGSSLRGQQPARRA